MPMAAPPEKGRMSMSGKSSTGSRRRWASGERACETTSMTPPAWKSPTPT